MMNVGLSFFSFNGQLKVLGPAYTAYVCSADYLHLSIKLELIFWEVNVNALAYDQAKLYDLPWHG